MLLVDVFDHDHLKLTGQQENGHHGQENVHAPIDIGEAAGVNG